MSRHEPATGEDLAMAVRLLRRADGSLRLHTLLEDAEPTDQAEVVARLVSGLRLVCEELERSGVPVAEALRARGMRWSLPLVDWPAAECRP